MAGTLWLVRRPFLMSRTRWAVALALAVAADVVAWSLTSPLVGAALLLLPAAVVSTLAHWRWLGRGENPIIFISLFEGRSSLGRDVANTHIGALARFLEEDQNLKEIGPFAIRKIPIPLTAKQAERLLRISGALTVIRGSGDAVGASSRWEWYACFRDGHPNLSMTKYEFSILNNQARRPLHRRFVAIAPAIAEAHDIEGGLQLTSFVTTDIAVGHFKAVGKTICVLGSERVFERALEDQPDEPYRLLLPDPADPDVARSLQGRIAIMEARTKLGQGGDHLEILESLQDLARSGLGSDDFGVWLQAQWYAATVERWVEKPAARDAGEELLRLFPDSASVASNAAGLAIQMQDLERGEELVNRTEHLDPNDPSIPRLRANIAWERHDPTTALTLYRQSNPPQIWQMGDCYAALGKPRRALHCYRKMLRRDSTARHALDHARAIQRMPKLLPTMPSGWRSWLWDCIHTRPRLSRALLWAWRLATPEDPWLTTWLARHALVVNELDIARRWIILTTRVGYTNRLIATMDALVVGALRREGDLPANVQHLKEHISWLEEQGETWTRPTGEAALSLLASARHDIFKGDHGEEIKAMFVAVGFEIPNDPLSRTPPRANEPGQRPVDRST